MIQVASRTSKAVADLSHGGGFGQVAEEHGNHMRPGINAFLKFIGFMFFNYPIKIIPI
jgi:hypothetical protein